jgi:hypothetical protein
MITALALVIGSTVLLTDPIFQGMAVSLLFGSIVATFLTLVVIPLGCFSAHRSFHCKDGSECPQKPIEPGPDDPLPPADAPGGGPAGGGDSGAGGSRPPRLAKRTDAVVDAAVVATVAAMPAAGGGRPPRLAKKSVEPEQPLVEQSAAPLPAGRPPRLAKKVESPLASTVGAIGGRPPRLEKRVEAAAPPDAEPELAVAAPAVSPASARPPRLEKQAAPPVAAAAAAAIEASEERETTVPAARPTRTKKKVEPELAPVVEAVPVVATPVPVAAEAAATPAKEPASFGKRKLRGIRIKIMDEGPDER